MGHKLFLQDKAASPQQIDGYVTPSAETGPVTILGLFGSARGATAGDQIVLRSGGPTGAVKCVITAATANGDFGRSYPDGKVIMDAPVYLSEISGANGKLGAEVVWA